ncbi:hypothetical protein L6452_00945 [Arctium lappa]|uniref:Uncharacterized protein n=1 Tax=Arctium lappa TaxID=4217 RepID=A0ACB9FG60_ARCLA|nr:hypothetical protein L6452_00945 [Arctium lappa]
MMRDFKFSRRNSGKNLNLEEPENVPVNANLRESSVARITTDSHSRPPLNTIQEPLQNPSKPDQESGFKSSKIYRTPTKPKVRYPESGMPMRTPEKQGVLARNRNGWGQDSRDDGRIGNVNTPRSCRTSGRTSSVFGEPNSTQSTPTKSVSKPPNPGLVYGGNSRPPIGGGVRMCNFAALSKGIPVTCNTSTNVNAIEVPHFDLREDPSFWMDHNVQVLIRIRPLNGMEIGTQGYSRCLKQESAQCLTWVGHPETRFTFDHVACETINQETLFKMVGLPMVENCLSGYNSCMFAYGQTGSGKTHTMLGEINDLEVKPSPYRGMTPRIFEFLFARIVAEEESRRDERLTYNCKCSFLEIYNEQITDLLDPSSTNLQLREDVKKGVYVENLTEFEVHTVNDILKLLSQGSANRRVASTNMNRESSRSHSVFTCVIESRWEKDSTSNLRFARLNLVDLAGSERQKSSGAEGERLKEAASINKSLSTLGHVIMVLVDGANARTRHVPYRDSRLTFLLQDSLGGNSKTMIIANVSPSISSAIETLNTLKFAQRAKLIQNNAVINEDASGDVTALQHQIRLLKEELAILKRYNISRSLTFSSNDVEETRQEHENCSNASSVEMNMLKFDNMLGDEGKVLRVSSKQLKSLETSLNGALRREQSTENSIKQLEAEIEQLNCLVRQREEENRCTKMMLKFREDKIQRMESLVAGSIPAGSYLLEENNTLSEEIRILRAKVDRNPEVTRFAVENIRLLEQLRRFQDFYEEGEREMLMTEVSELRDQLVLFLDENSKEDNNMNSSTEKEAAEDQKENDSLQLELIKSQEELEKCRDSLNSCLEKNSKLCREIVELNALLEMQKSVVHDQDGGIEVIKEPILEFSSIGDESSHTVQKMDESLADTKQVLDLELELDILKIILKEERLTRGETEEKALSLSRDLKLTEEKFLSITKQCESLREELQEAKSVIEALEIQQLVSINELEDLKNSNKQYAETLREKELKIIYLNDQILSQVSRDPPPSSNNLENEDSPLQAKLNKVQASLSKAKRLNMWYQADQACHASNEEEMDEVRRQVESETTEVIVCLQEELDSFQRQMHESSLKERETQQEFTLLQEKLEAMTECNKALREKCEAKDRQLSSLSEEIEDVLTTGHKMLDDASDQLGPGKRTWVSEQLQVIARNISEKELRIEELNSCLENAKTRGNEMECMLRSLRGATLVMSEAHQQDCSKKDEEIHQLLSQLDDTVNQKEEQNRAMSVCATAAFVIVNRFSDIKDGCLEALNQKEAELDKLKESLSANESLIHNQAVAIGDAEKQIRSLKEELETAGAGIGSSHGVNKDLNIDEDVKLVIPSCDQKTEVTDLHSKKQNPRSIEIILPQVLDLQAVVDNFQEQVGAAMVSLDCKLRTVEELLQQSNKSCFQKRKLYELELTDAKLNAAEKAVESSCYLDKFQEIQHNINEADLMIYELVTANEAMKIDIAELKKKEVTFVNEMDMLKDSYLVLEKQFQTDTVGMKRVVEELRGKLLADIKNSFDRISRKEDEAGELSIKVTSFEKKILDLQLLEEAMLERSSHMGHELSMLMKEMDISHQNQQVINDKDEEIRCLEEKLATDLGAKEIELLIILSRLEQMASENNDLEKEKISMSVVLEKFKEDMIISYVDMQLKDWILQEKDDEVGLLQKEVKMQEEALKISYNHSSALEQMASEANVLEKEKINMSMVLEKVKEEMIISYVDMQLKDWILLEKEAAIGLLQKEVKMQEETLKISCNCSSALDKMASETNDLKENISMSTVLEKFKEDVITSYVDMQLKDWILLEKDSEIGLLQKQVMTQEEALKISCNRSSALDKMTSKNNHLEEKIISMSTLVEKFKEDMIISYVDMQLKDWMILLEKDAEIGVLQKEAMMQEEALQISYNRNSVLEQMASETNDLEKEKISMSTVLEKFKEDMIISYVDVQLKDWILLEKDSEIGLLQKEVTMQEEALKISFGRSSALDKMASKNNDLEGKIISMSTVLEKFKEDMIISYVDMQLKDWILLEKDAEIGLLQKEVMMQEEALELSYNSNSALEQMAANTNDLEKEKISMFVVFEKLKEDMIILHADMQLKDWIFLEKDAEVGLLQKEVKMHEEKALQISYNCSSALEQMASETNHLKKEKISMSAVFEKFKEDMIISYVDMQLKDWILLEKGAEVGALQKEVVMLEEALKSSYNRSSALEQMASEKNDLEKEKIKEDLISLYVDMQLKVEMQEEARKEENETLVVIIKDQKDKIQEFEASIETLEYELYENVVKGHVLETQLKEKVTLISTLEADISTEREYIKSLSSEIHLLTENVEDTRKAKESTKEQLAEIMKAKESLDIEILELETVLDKNNTLIESLKGDLETITCEKSDLHAELLRARKEVEMAQAQAEEHEAIAMKAKQTGEISIRYAEEKEEESKLYEKSVEELECTVNVLENQVEMVKGEAERQRLQREELEVELHALKRHIHTVKNSDSDMRRRLDDEKEKNLQDVLQRIKILEKEITSKDAEVLLLMIVQHKDHITELNLHAEAQAKEYKQTFKALEAMADQVKPDGTSPYLSNSPSKRLERNGSRSRGSGSPFKCIGLGLVQQLKSERDEELIAARARIEELETLAASRQKEIFTLNSKLAMSGSMTHDVLRDLLGIKSDMTTYSSIVDDNRIEEVTRKIPIHGADPQVKEQEVIKLKEELNEFVVERQRWHEEIERKQVEMEQICLQDQLLATENEMFKKKVIDLEAEIKKLSGQQNIQQRIHHHAKIKEENNSLKAQNDEISHKLRRSEAIVTRVKEELASLRAANNLMKN